MKAVQARKVHVVEALRAAGATVDKENNDVIMHFPDASNYSTINLLFLKSTLRFIFSVRF